MLVQRDIGRLAQYTVEMGGAIDLLEIALKIPPWEPMRLLSRDELRGMKIVTGGDAPEVNSGAATASPPLANGSRAAIQERSWVMLANAGRVRSRRKHPLTVEGDEIGSFDLTFACGEPGKDLTVTYFEQRRGRRPQAPTVLTDVEISIAGKSVPLKVVSSQPGGRSPEFDSVARGRVPVELFKTFADPRSRSLLIETDERGPARPRSGSAMPASRAASRSWRRTARAAADPQHARTELRREAEVRRGDALTRLSPL